MRIRLIEVAYRLRWLFVTARRWSGQKYVERLSDEDLQPTVEAQAQMIIIGYFIRCGTWLRFEHENRP